MNHLAMEGAQARTARRAALLRACAIAALFARPALAAPPSLPRAAMSRVVSHLKGDARAFPLQSDRALPLKLGGRNGGGNASLPPLLSSPQLTVDRGLFEIQVNAPTSNIRPDASGAAPRNVGAKLGLPPAPLTLRPQEVDRLLVSGHSAPPADSASFDRGAIVLLSLIHI